MPDARAPLTLERLVQLLDQWARPGNSAHPSRFSSPEEEEAIDLLVSIIDARIERHVDLHEDVMHGRG